MAKLSQFYYLTTFFAITVNAINCYECTSGQDRTCGHYVGTSCAYGFFGCVKIGLLMDFPNQKIGDNKLILTLFRHSFKFKYNRRVFLHEFSKFRRLLWRCR